MLFFVKHIRLRFQLKLILFTTTIFIITLMPLLKSSFNITRVNSNWLFLMLRGNMIYNMMIYNMIDLAGVGEMCE